VGLVRGTHGAPVLGSPRGCGGNTISNA
jgi:hypothetical protein